MLHEDERSTVAALAMRANAAIIAEKSIQEIAKNNETQKEEAPLEQAQAFTIASIASSYDMFSLS